MLPDALPVPPRHTPQARVVALHPGAAAIRRGHRRYTITAPAPDGVVLLGSGPSPAGAWFDAAHRLDDAEDDGA
ncbi:hypothetical protein M0638_12935 [Roseomonas sp. NAR14]|uniref:Uncharacterized protein n=1 Tax=Roseomonas acroporae TaxID=2937791 RepID=A0A9X1Y901_9PROT|nr:hypothetical protein [Roseomonas acroporae]MCK8785290.1 hypothetical protein [Roseomonas acroporae]